MADLRSLKRLRTSSSSNSEKSPKAKPRKGCKSTSEDGQDSVRLYATDAICFYNSDTRPKYKLVEPGNISSVDLPTCSLHHIDFTAKRTGVGDVPEEMFFAELTTTDKGRQVKFCNCMGPKNSISGDKNNGCCYCKSYNVQHPMGGGFMAGGSGLFTDENDYNENDYNIV
ncbi:hypothetical protein MKW92_037018 [Papaver armeniacum]|nr:hypothetical protein MKW92_037018 [Papaver armeniacum]